MAKPCKAATTPAAFLLADKPDSSHEGHKRCKVRQDHHMHAACSWLAFPVAAVCARAVVVRCATRLQCTTATAQAGPPTDVLWSPFAFIACLLAVPCRAAWCNHWLQCLLRSRLHCMFACLVALQEIEVPDAADAAAHQDASDAIRKYRLTRLTPVVIVCECATGVTGCF